MKPRKRAVKAPQRIIKVGGLYRDAVRSVNVTAEDHEILDGHRTGRILVCASDGKFRFPRRWYCDATDLAEVQCDLVELIPTDDGVSP